MGFDKYENHGPYHWRPAHPGAAFWRYDPRSDSNYKIALRLLRANLPPAANGQHRVLDVACGDGVMCYEMAGTGISVVGLDLEGLALRLAREQLDKRSVKGVELKEGLAEQMPFPDASFDGVVAMELIEHLDPKTSSPAFVSEAFRVLRPTGVLLVTTPQKLTPEFRSEYHTQEFTGGELENYLGKWFPRVEVYAYYPPERDQRYASRPYRYALKLACAAGYPNPFLEIRRQPAPRSEHIVGVARKGA